MGEKSKTSARIAEIDQCFGLLGQSLALQGRVLIAEGVLTKSCRNGIKPRQFFLFNDILVYGTILVQNIKYTKQHIIPLQDVSVRMLSEGEGEVDHGWVVNTRTKSFTLFAATRAEKLGWIEAINKCTAKLLERSGKSACREFAPVMLPNNSVSSCMSCHIEFGLLVRRVHCKKCGRVVCVSCAGNKIILPTRPDKPLRVCLSCFTLLLELKKEREAAKNEHERGDKTVCDGANDSDDDEDYSTTKPLNPRHYQLAEAGLWWDSFEEDPVFEEDQLFDVYDEIDKDLTLNEETSFSLKSNDDDVAGDKEETDDDKRELKIASSQAQV